MTRCCFDDDDAAAAAAFAAGLMHMLRRYSNGRDSWIDPVGPRGGWLLDLEQGHPDVRIEGKMHACPVIPQKIPYRLL